MPACFFSALPCMPKPSLTHPNVSATQALASASPSLADPGSLGSTAWQPLSCYYLSWKRQQLWAMDTCSHLSVPPSPQPALLNISVPWPWRRLLQGWTEGRKHCLSSQKGSHLSADCHLYQRCFSPGAMHQTSSHLPSGYSPHFRQVLPPFKK